MLVRWALFFLALSVLPAAAQNPTCPTRPTGDSTNACASTAFVHNGFLPIGQSAGGDLSGTYPNPIVVNGSNITNGSIQNSALANPYSLTIKTPYDFGAVGNGTTNDTTAMQNLFNYTGPKYLPCGTYLVSTLTYPGTNAGIDTGGAGTCAIIEQDSADAANNIITLGNGILNNLYDVNFSNFTIRAAVQKTAGAGFYGKGTARIHWRNIYMDDNHMWNGYELDGVDFHAFHHAYVSGAGSSEILAYDGFDCGFTPVATTTTANTAVGGTTLVVASHAGLVAGMQFYDISLSGNAYQGGTIATTPTTNNVTITGSPPVIIQINSGDTLIFGSTCAPTGLVIDEDTQLSYAGPAGGAVEISGGIGGVEINSMDELLSTHGFVSNTNRSHGIQNRELFMGSGSFIDSNSQQGVYLAANSFTKFICTGCWVSASGTQSSVYIGPQITQHNPFVTGGISQFSNCTITQTNGAGIDWEDEGTLLVNGCDTGHQTGSTGTGIVVHPANVGTGSVIITNNTIMNNSENAVAIINNPASFIATGNIWTGNPFPPTITPSATVLCSGNLGGSGGC